MIQVIRSSERYHFETDWLSTYWHFSFDHYYDPANMSFGPLRVFNDDVIRPGGGFPFHSHREMEIVTYLIEGRLEHRDSLGNVGVIQAGEIQRMSAGTGVRHSEYNASKELPVHLIQLWLLPAVAGLEPSWEQKQFSLEARQGRLLPIAMPAEGLARAEKSSGAGPASYHDVVFGGSVHAVRVHQHAFIYTSLLSRGSNLIHPLGTGRRAYLFLIAGELQLNQEKLAAGDQARITGEGSLQLAAQGSTADFLLLDLP